MEKDLDYKLYEQRENLFYHQPNANEDAFYQMVVSGDTERILENKRKYGSGNAPGKGRLSADPLKNEIYHMIINTALIARACQTAGLPHEVAYTLSDLYIGRTDDCRNVEEVMALNDAMVMDFATHMKELHYHAQLSAVVMEAVNYIYDNLHTPITTKRLAQHVHMNRSSFVLRFKAETGYTVNDFIAKIRLDTAKNILLATDYRIIDISNSLCFSSQSYFCRKFQQAVGMTPAAYRRKYQKMGRQKRQDAGENYG